MREHLSFNLVGIEVLAGWPCYGCPKFISVPQIFKHPERVSIALLKRALYRYYPELIISNLLYWPSMTQSKCKLP